MKWILFLVASLLLIPFLSAQKLNDLDSPSNDHLQIKGTQVFLIPPEGFSASSNFKGFQNPEDPTSMIMLVEIPGPFSEISAGFNEEQLAANGMTLHKKESIEINAFEGLWINLDQAANGMTFSKHILIYGDSSATTLINGVFVSDSINLGEGIRQSLLSLVVDPLTVADPRGTLDYTLDETGTDFQFLNVMGNAMLFNRDGLIPTESEDKAMLVVDKSFAQMEFDPSEQENFCIARLDQYPEPYEYLHEEGLEPVEVDGLTGFALYALNSNEEEEAYQVILFQEGGGYFVFFGSYLTGEEKAKTDILKLIQSFKRVK